MAEPSPDKVVVNAIGPLITAVIGPAIGWLPGGLTGAIGQPLTVLLAGLGASVEEQQLEGIAKAKAAGVYKGRPASIDAARVRELKAQGGGPRSPRPSASAAQAFTGRWGPTTEAGGHPG